MIHSIYTFITFLTMMSPRGLYHITFKTIRSFSHALYYITIKIYLLLYYFKTICILTMYSKFIKLQVVHG